jgi:RNA polymerase sigma factor (TIGR02999 family)
MGDVGPGPVTRLLNAAGGGDDDAAAELLPFLYGELHRIAQAMRQILVDQARRGSSLKRGDGRRRLDLDDVEPAVAPPSVDILALDDALGRLERHDPRKARIVMLRYFAGLTAEETAAALDISVPTVEREWRFTRTRLRMQLANDEGRS